MDYSKITDTHCHLQHRLLKGRVEEMIIKIKEKMAFAIVSGANAEWNREALEIAKNAENIYATLGLHPMDAEKLSEKDFNKEVEFIEKNKEKLVGIGEIGLDYHWEKDEKMRGLQKERFVVFLKLAKKLDVPVVIHSWDAEADALDILAREGMKKVVMHCFSGNAAEMKRAIEKGYYISISTAILRSKSTRKLARDCPLEKMLLETDAPYLWAAGEANVPWNTELAAEKIAQIKKTGKEDVLEATFNNAKNVFGIG